jgi:hypothetical protein
VYCVVSGHDRVGVLWSSQTTRNPWASISRLLLTPNSFVYLLVPLLPSTLRYTLTVVTNLGYTRLTNPDAFGAMLEAWLNWSSSPTHPSPVRSAIEALRL